MLNQNNIISIISLPEGNTPSNQKELNLGIEKETEKDGIEMGVLSDGTAFLSGRGLAKLCDVSHSKIIDIAEDWNTSKPRISSIKNILLSHNISVIRPYIPIKSKGTTIHTFPDYVCVAVLEYYAFEAGINIKKEAQKNYRKLAGKALREYIYKTVGYNQLDKWKPFHDRISSTYNSVPDGYFCIFKESSDLILSLIQNDIPFNNNFVLDISIGLRWAKYWKDNHLETKYGDRNSYKHNYPEYFPQAKSNPQEPQCYPEEALGCFKRWLREDYIRGGYLKSYLTNKTTKLTLPASYVEQLLKLFENKEKEIA